MKTRSSLSVALVLAGALAVTLSACTASDTPEPKPTTSTTAKAAPPKTGSCIGGQLIITDKDLEKKAFTVDKPCGLVAVLAHGATVTIRSDVTTLSLEGSNNVIDAQGISDVAAFGSGNTVKHTGAQPELANTGQGTPAALEFEQK